MMHIGFIGLGSMGGDQVKCLAAAGFDLTVYDVYPPSMEVFSGAMPILSASACAMRSRSARRWRVRAVC